MINPGIFKGIISIKENKKGEFVYLIKYGECKIISERNPLEFYNKLKNEAIKKDSSLNAISGYMSTSINRFQIGVVGAGQWVGDEIILLKNDPHEYSVVANSHVIAYEISKEEYLLKFPKEILNLFRTSVIEKYRFILKRFESISYTSKDISDLNPLSQKFDNSLQEAKKKFPQINPTALIRIRKKTIINLSNNDSSKSKYPDSSQYFGFYERLKALSKNKSSLKNNKILKMQNQNKSVNLNINEGPIIKESKEEMKYALNRYLVPAEKSLPQILFTSSCLLKGSRSNLYPIYSKRIHKKYYDQNSINSYASLIGKNVDQEWNIQLRKVSNNSSIGSEKNNVMNNMQVSPSQFSEWINNPQKHDYSKK